MVRSCLCALALLLLWLTACARAGTAGGGQADLAAHGPVGENCEQHTTTTSQFEEYFDIDRIGNNRSKWNVVELTLFVQVHNMQEEMAFLLSASNRSRQHPDYSQTYELRISNVYTVLYRETLRMSAHHSHTFNFFPGERFRLRVQITRSGHITVNIPGLQKPLILAVEDERTPIEVAYISFGSRMNAYPVTIYFNCRGPRADADGGDGGQQATAVQQQQQQEQQNAPQQQQQQQSQRPAGSGEDGRDGNNNNAGSASDSEEGQEEQGEEGEEEKEEASGGRDEAGPLRPAAQPSCACPACPRPEKCEVIVKACSDTSKDLLMQPSAAENGEKQKYFFYFNVYLSRKGERGGGAARQADSGAPTQAPAAGPE